MKRILAVVCAVAVGIAGGCATPGRSPAVEPVTSVSPAGGYREERSITYTHEEKEALGLVVRRLAAAGANDIVVAAGLEAAYVLPFSVRNASLDEVARLLAESTGANLQECPGYYYLYLPEYEPVTSYDLGGRLPSAYEETTVSTSFAAGLRVGIALQWLSRACGLTIAADNIMADGYMGEMHVSDVSVATALEGLLKSSTSVGFELETVDGCVLLRSQQNQSRRDPFLDGGDLAPAQADDLAREVDVVLPLPPRRSDAIDLRQRALPLEAVAPSLAQQLGVPVRYDAAVREFPVNPAAFTGVPLRTAMNLLVRQWPVSGVGWEHRGDHLYIRPVESAPAP